MGDPTRPPPTRRRRWVRRLAILAILAGGLFAARGSLLRGYAELLVVDESGKSADAISPASGEARLAVAARLYLAGDVSRILLGHGPKERVADLGLVPDRMTASRRKLADLGVPDAAITDTGRSDWDTYEGVRRIGVWLTDHPGATVQVTCDRFASRRLRLITDRVLGPDAARLVVRPMPYRRYSDADWWRVDDGRREVVMQTLCLAYTLVAGERSAPRPDWDPDAYEAALR